MVDDVLDDVLLVLVVVGARVVVLVLVDCDVELVLVLLDVLELVELVDREVDVL